MPHKRNSGFTARLGSALKGKKMCLTVKQFVLDCIKQRRGDDLYRAQCAFKNCTSEEMNQELGQSGRTRQQVLDGYIAHNQECDAAIKAVERLL